MTRCAGLARPVGAFSRWPDTMSSSPDLLSYPYPSPRMPVLGDNVVSMTQPKNVAAFGQVIDDLMASS